MRRLAFILVASLVAGFVTNVLIAWMFAITIDPHSRGFAPGGMNQIGDLHWSVMNQAAFATHKTSSVFQRGVNPGRTTLWPAECLPFWVNIDQPTAEFTAAGADYEHRVFEARGWPLLSLWCEREQFVSAKGRQVARKTGGLATPLPGWVAVRPPTGPPITEPRILPLNPIWSGTIINTLLFGFLFWALVFGWRDARRLIRRRRGQCRGCGYPIGTADRCTECGALVRPAPPTA